MNIVTDKTSRVYLVNETLVDSDPEIISDIISLQCTRNYTMYSKY